MKLYKITLISVMLHMISIYPSAGQLTQQEIDPDQSIPDPCGRQALLKSAGNLWKTPMDIRNPQSPTERIFICPLEVKVGLGLQHPEAKFHVRSDQPYQIMLTGADEQQNVGIRFYRRSVTRVVKKGVSESVAPQSWNIGMDQKSGSFKISSHYTGDLNSNPHLTINNSGRVGVGTDNPGQKLDVIGNMHASGDVYTDGTVYASAFSSNSPFVIQVDGNDVAQFSDKAGEVGYLGLNTKNPQERLHVHDGAIQIDGNASKWSSWNTRIISPVNSAWVTSDANDNGDRMSIGMTNTGWYFGMSPNAIGNNTSNIRYTFYVDTDGLLTAREIRVTQAQWWDKVFEKDYDLTPISELENYVRTNKHLPNIPTEEEVLNNGVKMGEMQAKLLQKIEELTLYVIQQQKEIETLKTKITD